MFDIFNRNQLPEIAKKWLPYFRQFNLRKKHFFLEKNNLRKKFGCEPLDSDVIWSFFTAVLQTRKSNQDIANVMKNMSKFLEDEGKLEKAKNMYVRAEIMEYKASGVVIGVEIIGCKDSCANCKKQIGKIFSINDALRKMPIPCKSCSYKYGCRCAYIPVLEKIL